MTPMPADKRITLTLTAADVNVVLAALNELPRKVSDDIFRSIVAQATQPEEAPDAADPDQAAAGGLA